MRHKIKIEKSSYLLFAIWLILNWDLSAINIVVGFLLSVFVAKLSKSVYFSHMGYHLHFPPILKFINFMVHVLYQIIVSSFKTLGCYFKKNTEPKVFLFPLEIREPLKIAFLANSITMTHGTVTIDVYSGYLKVLTLHHKTEEELKEDIHRGLERYLI